MFLDEAAGALNLVAAGRDAARERLSISPQQEGDEQKEIFMRYLSRFPILSVREDKGKELIRELTGKEAKVVLDPT